MAGLIVDAGDGAGGRRALAATLACIGALVVARVAVLFATPLQLYPDEAQYWAWSRHLAFGYFSKPPMIAWMVALTTGLGGNGEAWVRLSAPLLHGAAALALQRAGSRFYGGWAGFVAAVLYALMPGVALSSVVIATDAPLLLFLALALWALGALWTTPGGGRWAAAAFGAALGAAALSKYAAFYMVAGLLAHAALAPQGRRRLWTRERVSLAAIACLLVFGPNLIWNAAHGFQTLAHTAADADLHEGEGGGRLAAIDPRGPLGFLASQLGVFGPIPFAVLVGASARALLRRRVTLPQDGLLLALTAPALLVVTAEAALARANANWAAAAYASGAVLAAALLVRTRSWTWLGLTLGVQAATALAVAVAVVRPDLADRAHLGNSFKQARGWRESAAAVQAHLSRAQASGLVDALAVDDRFLFNALAYYGRDWKNLPPQGLRMWVHEARAHNQAEAQHPLVTARRVAFVAATWPREARADFTRVEEAPGVVVPVGDGRSRTLRPFVGLGFAPRPRDPVSGLPTPP